MLLTFSPLQEDQKIEDFDCGEDDLNFYLKNHALSNQLRKLSSTVVAYSEAKIIGYYTLSPAQIEREILPVKLSRGLPNYPIAAIRLCRLAIDRHHQGKGLGEELLMHALMKCLHISNEIGGYVVIVDAKNLNAQKFYERYGFKAFPSYSLYLYLRIKDIAEKKEAQ